MAGLYDGLEGADCNVGGPHEDYFHALSIGVYKCLCEYKTNEITNYTLYKTNEITN